MSPVHVVRVVGLERWTGDIWDRVRARDPTAQRLRGDLMSTSPSTLCRSTSSDLTVLPGEALVCVGSSPVFPAVLRPDDAGRLCPRFRPAIAVRVLEHFFPSDEPDSPDADSTAMADWDGTSIVISTSRPGDGIDIEQVPLGPDRRYELLPDLCWAAPTEPAPSVFEDLLARASAFTLDVNTMAYDAPGWDERLVIDVRRYEPDQWYVADGGHVLNQFTGQWLVDGPDLRAPDVIRDVYTGRDTAITAALRVLRRRRDDIRPADASHPLLIQGRHVPIR